MMTTDPRLRGLKSHLTQLGYQYTYICTILAAIKIQFHYYNNHIKYTEFPISQHYCYIIVPGVFLSEVLYWPRIHFAGDIVLALLATHSTDYDCNVINIINNKSNNIKTQERTVQMFNSRLYLLVLLIQILQYCHGCKLISLTDNKQKTTNHCVPSLHLTARHTACF